MNRYVAINRYGINGKLSKVKGDSEQLLLMEVWVFETGYTGHRTMGTSSNIEDIASDHPSFLSRLAWRHNKGMNYLKKDGSVDWTGPGKSGYGEKLIWYYTTDGSYWQDGSLKTP